METRRLGKTGCDVSVLTFGAMRLDEKVEISTEILYALESGVTAIDTARAYGESEAIIGRTLKAWSGPTPFISTKIKAEPGNWRHYIPLEKAYTPEIMIRSVEASLTHLGVECLDLVYLHQWYYLWTHRPEWLETFRQLKQAGKIKAFGISAQDHEHDALLQVVDAGLVDVVQVILNIFESRPLVSLVPLCQMRDIGVVARCVLDDGALTGHVPVEAWGKETWWLNSEFAKAYERRLEALKKRFCQDGMSLAELAIRFAMTHSGVSSLAMSMQPRRFADENSAAAKKGGLDQAVYDAIVEDFVWSKNFFQPAFMPVEP